MLHQNKCWIKNVARRVQRKSRNEKNVAQKTLRALCNDFHATKKSLRKKRCVNCSETCPRKQPAASALFSGFWILLGEFWGCPTRKAATAFPLNLELATLNLPASCHPAGVCFHLFSGLL